MSTLKYIPKPCMMKMAEGTDRTIRLVDTNNKEEVIMTPELEDYLYSKYCKDSSTYFEDTEKEFLTLLRTKRIVYMNGCYGLKKKKVKKIFVVYFNCWDEEHCRCENIRSFTTMAKATKFMITCREEAKQYKACRTSEERKNFLDTHEITCRDCIYDTSQWEFDIDELEIE